MMIFSINTESFFPRTEKAYKDLKDDECSDPTTAYCWMGCLALPDSCPNPVYIFFFIKNAVTIYLVVLLHYIIFVLTKVYIIAGSKAKTY